MKSNGKRLAKIMTAFLLAAAVMTFLSRTIYNLNLPEVTAVLPAGGRLADVVDKEATIAYAQADTLYAGGPARVGEVHVAAGQSVAAGQRLMTLQPDQGRIDELELRILKQEQDIELLTRRLEGELSEDAPGGAVMRHAQRLADARERLRALEAEYAGLQSAARALRDGIVKPPREAEFALNLDTARRTLSDRQTLYELGEISSRELMDAENALTALTLQYEQYLAGELNARQAQADAKQREAQSARDALDALELEGAGLATALTREQAEMELAYLRAELPLLKRQLASAGVTEVAAATAGVVTELNARRGETVALNSPLLTLADGVSGYILEVALDESERERVGAAAEIRVKVSGYPWELKAELLSSNVSQESGESVHRLTLGFPEPDAEILDELRAAGAAAAVTFTAYSNTYETIIPVTALRQDDKGYFVLTLRREEDVFGESFVARRIDVRLLDSDSSLAAIDGLTYREPVAETGTAELRHGSRVSYEG